jgi:hypothetical protein
LAQEFESYAWQKLSKKSKIGLYAKQICTNYMEKYIGNTKIKKLRNNIVWKSRKYEFESEPIRNTSSPRE